MVTKVFNIEKGIKIIDIWPFYVNLSNCKEIVLWSDNNSAKKEEISECYFIINEDNAVLLVNFDTLNVELYCEIVKFSDKNQIKDYDVKIPKVNVVHSVSSSHLPPTSNNSLPIKENYFNLTRASKPTKKSQKIIAFSSVFKEDNAFDFEIIEDKSRNSQRKSKALEECINRVSQPFFVTCSIIGEMYFWSFRQSSLNSSLNKDSFRIDDIDTSTKSNNQNDNSNNNNTGNFSNFMNKFGFLGGFGGKKEEKNEEPKDILFVNETKEKTNVILGNELTEKEKEEKVNVQDFVGEATDMILVDNKNNGYYIITGYLNGTIKVWE